MAVHGLLTVFFGPLIGLWTAIGDRTAIGYHIHITEAADSARCHQIIMLSSGHCIIEAIRWSDIDHKKKVLSSFQKGRRVVHRNLYFFVVVLFCRESSRNLEKNPAEFPSIFFLFQTSARCVRSLK